MARKLESLLGQRFGKLIVIGEPINTKGNSYSLCKCDCGDEKIIRNSRLKSGKTKSCGCRKTKKLVGQKFGKLTVIGEPISIDGIISSLCKCDCGNEKLIANFRLKNGNSKSCGLCVRKYNPRLKRIFGAIKDRCLNEKAKAYMRYGGRGIKICKEWLEDSYSFYSWALENGYDDNLSIDRIDVDGDYEPLNCRWTTMYVQANNKKNNVFLVYNNEKKSISQWSKIYKINRGTAGYRYKKGLQFEEIFEVNKSGE